MPEIHERKCRVCERWSKLAILSDVCPKCGAPYGRWEVGMDRVIPVTVGKRGSRK